MKKPSKTALKLQSQYALAQYVNYARKLFRELPPEEENDSSRTAAMRRDPDSLAAWPLCLRTED